MADQKIQVSRERVYEVAQQLRQLPFFANVDTNQSLQLCLEYQAVCGAMLTGNVHTDENDYPLAADMKTIQKLNRDANALLRGIVELV